ncbi:DUF4192 family protein [Gryllotalpicola sp.]|uniref:DUF4192 family protein n=1 Tax=Gryllotalpicola sp. TaxID=1932787 RepID=UPI00260C1216|nr:DUF4192 family protein [Gryllotalpicola sp.]
MTSPDQSVIRLRSPRDVLATVPRLLGYRPRDSVVLLSVHAGARASTLRFDLPPASAGGQAVSAITGMLCRLPHVEAVVVAIYTDEAFEAESPPQRALAALLAEQLDRGGFRVHDVLCVAADGWARYSDGARHPLGELDMPAPGDPGGEAIADDIAELAAMIAADVEAALPRRRRPAGLLLVAYDHWLRGQSSIAARLLDRAIELDPSNRAARRLRAALDEGVLPDSAFDLPRSG